MVGDDLINIKGAQLMGMHTVLVQTGKYRKALVDESNIVPDGCISSIKNCKLSPKPNTIKSP